MSYMHIENLYKNADVLLFKEVYALEKVHGTSAHICYNPETPILHFFAGGAKRAAFVQLFKSDLRDKFAELFSSSKVYVYGEAYGGKVMGMSKYYGPELGFIGFEVKVGDLWLSVPNAHDVCNKLGLPFVAYAKVPAELEAINAERDKPSALAKFPDVPREGVVIRPPIEVTLNNGSRLIAKHKRPEFMETKTPREFDPTRLQVLTEAKEIAEEWATEMRLTHVLDKLCAAKNGEPVTMADTLAVIQSMQEDIKREGEGELEWGEAVGKEIGRKTAQMLKQMIAKQTKEATDKPVQKAVELQPNCP